MKSCLVVDDSKVVRKVARKIVEDIGFTCEEAENGEEAYNLCLKQMPAAILLDWNMPVMDGLEFLVKLRKSEGGKEPKVIFCTTENDMLHIQKAMQAGANEYVMKPFDNQIIESKFYQVGLLSA